MGSFAFSLEDGMTTTDPGEAYTKELVIGRAREVILLADSGKLGTRSLVQAGRLDAVDILVTDDGIDERAARTLARLAAELNAEERRAHPSFRRDVWRPTGAVRRAVAGALRGVSGMAGHLSRSACNAAARVDGQAL
jgi:hypothetical protein